MSDASPMTFPPSFLMGTVDIEIMCTVPKQDSKSIDTALLLYDVSMFAMQEVKITHAFRG